MVELLISEKPQSALKIATALADDKVIKKENKKIPYYEVKHKGKKIIVGCAVGHLFGLKEIDGKGWTYPTFNYDWIPIYEVNKAAKHTKPYIETLKKLVKEADEFTICTDFDDEGSLLGYNVLRFIAKKNDAARMKFSTLTKKDLVSSYENKFKTLDFGQIFAGETRHTLDWAWGINLSRALTLSVKNAKGGFKILSIGRVQGPTLNLIVNKEKEILSFKPVPYWQVSLVFNHDGKDFTAEHKKNPFWKKNEAEKALQNTKNSKAIISKIKKSEIIQAPPTPFDLTTLQLEAYRTLGINPKETLSLAQNLYVNGLISYPRTSSQQIPPSIDLREILTKLFKSDYADLVKELLKKQLQPNNGKKTDPAHPAIIPTGEIPEKLTDREFKLYDLITRRTLATLAEPAKRESLQIEININKELFALNGIKTIYPGWHKYYGHFLMLKETELPEFRGGQEIKNYRKKIKIYDIFTYNGEADILEIRLNILKDYVDQFIIVEAPTTFSGLNKPLYFKEQKERFNPFLNKIKYFVINNYPNDKKLCKLADSSSNVPKNGPEHWRREFFQKETKRKIIQPIHNFLAHILQHIAWSI